MRFFAVKQDTDLKSLAQQLLRAPEAAPGALAKLQAMNPHVDLQRIAAGTVLLLPDVPGLAAEEASTTADSFETFRRDLTDSMRRASGRVRDDIARRDQRNKEVGAVLGSAAVRQLATDDSELRQHLDAAGKRIENDGKQARHVATQLDRLEQGLAAELAKLARLTD